jgi:hypothetical protein
MWPGSNRRQFRPVFRLSSYESSARAAFFLLAPQASHASAPIPASAAGKEAFPAPKDSQLQPPPPFWGAPNPPDPDPAAPPEEAPLDAPPEEAPLDIPPEDAAPDAPLEEAPLDVPLEDAPLDAPPDEPPDAPPPEDPLEVAPEEPLDAPPEEPPEELLDAPLEEPLDPPLEDPVEVHDDPDSNAPRSGAMPEKGRPTLCPLSMRALPCCSLKKFRQGKLPSAWRGPSTPVVDTVWKSVSAIVTESVHEL